MADPELRERLAAAAVPRGRRARALVVGPWRLRIEGLDRKLADALDLRWGGFASPAVDGSEDLAVVVTDAGPRPWLDPARPGEPYRVEGRQTDLGPALVSYRFAAVASGSGSWRVALSGGRGEREDRAIENAVRMLSARLAVERGGFAVHGAGVARGDRAHVFAGPSGAGKSTAVRLSSPCVSLGDDFAVLYPAENGWCTAAVPFDNAERAPAATPLRGFTLAGLWRLRHGPPDRPARIELPPPAARAAAIVACAASPWTLPDLGDRLLETAARLAAEVRFGELHFRLAPDLWNALPG